MTPNTTVYLFSTPFDISNEYVIKADSEADAWGIVSSYPSIVKTNCYWQRTDGFVFRCDGNINDLSIYNYCVFINNGKRNYAFITSMQYCNDAMTWIYLDIDFWFNFAGQYTFNPSPMIRCHPENDDFTANNFFTEPINVNRWYSQDFTAGEPKTDDQMVCLVTSLKTDSFAANSHLWVNGTGQLLQTGSSSDLETWYDNQIANMTMCGAAGQPSTSVLSVTDAQNVMSNFSKNGGTGYLLGAYHIPLYFRTNVYDGTKDITVFVSPPIDISVPAPSRGPIANQWKKIQYSHQFNRVVINLTGNVREISLDYLSSNQIAEQPIEFTIEVDCSSNGCAVIMPKIPGSTLTKEIYNYVVQSKPWDKIQLSAFGINRFEQAANAIDYRYGTGSNIMSGVNGIVGIAAGLLTLNPGAAIGGANSIVDAGLGQLALEEKTSLREEITSSKGGVTMGTPSTSISAYNLVAPLIAIMRYYPSAQDCINISKMFATYGYIQGGTIQPIIFNMPKWSYYKTAQASIEGDQVPQKFLLKMISRFNAGIFVFSTKSDYKKFNLWQQNHL